MNQKDIYLSSECVDAIQQDREHECRGKYIADLTAPKIKRKWLKCYCKCHKKKGYE